MKTTQRKFLWLAIAILIFPLVCSRDKKLNSNRLLQEDNSSNINETLSDNGTNTGNENNSGTSNNTSIENFSNISDNNSNNSNESNTSNATKKEILNSTYLKIKDKVKIVKENCHEYIIDKDYKSIELQLDDLKNVTHILISEFEVEFKSCDFSAFKGCSNKSHYCIYEDELPKEVNIDITHCFKKLYLYVYINNTNISELTNGSDDEIEFGEIEIGKYKNNDDICEEIDGEDWDYCYNLDIKNCSSNNTSICDKSCKWINCSYTVQSIPENFELCVPSDLPASNKTQDICIGNFDFNQSLTKTLDFQYCGLALNVEEGSVFKKAGKTLSILFVAIIVIVVAIFLLVLTVCWYRWKLKETKIPPFTPPTCCPECLFPRPPSLEEYAEQPEYQQIS